MGIFRGFQMLGEWVHDPLGIEGEAGTSEGLGLFAMQTELTADFRLTNVQGHLTLDGQTVAAQGYEILAGRSSWAADQKSPIILSDGSLDGLVSDCNQGFGTYLHGILTALKRHCAFANGLAQRRLKRMITERRKGGRLTVLRKRLSSTSTSRFCGLIYKEHAHVDTNSAPAVCGA